MMKRLFLYAAVAAVCVSCGGKKAGYTIDGKIVEGSQADLEGKYVYLIPYGADGAAVDSALIEKGAFKLQGEPTAGGLYTLYVKGGDDEMMSRFGEAPFSTVFVLEKGTMQAVMDSFSYVTGTPENDAFKEIRAMLNETKKSYTGLIDGLKADDEAAKKKASELEENMMTKVKAYLEAHPNQLTTAKLLGDFQFELDEKVQEAVLAKADSAFMNVPGIKELAEHLEMMKKVAVGQKFTDFEMADLKGDMHKLSDYAGKGNVTLVDFWASWCGPCMREMPSLKKTYEAYHKKGFEVVGISLDSNKSDWEAAVKDKQLNWIHLSDLKGWQSDGAALYGIRSIPNTYLLDKDGTIIGHNLTGEELDKKLEELLAEK